jgi:hypothetical protein
MTNVLRVAVAIGVAVGVGCRPSTADGEREQEREREGDRAVALAAAQDTARRQWRHEVGVDSVQMRGDTTVVWVSPRNWMATDAPQAGVRVLPRGRVAGIQWILGG